MKLQPDHLFQSKLEHLHIPAPEAAWDRIEINLNKKKNALWMWKVAAALVPVAVALFYLMPDNANTSNTKNTIAVLKTAPVIIERPVKTVEPTNNSPAIASTEKKKTTANKKIASSSAAPSAQEDVLIEEATICVAVTGSVEAVHELQSETQRENTIIVSAPIEEMVASTTLILPAEEVNKKYLIDPSLVDATSDTKTTSSLQRLLEKAADLKSNTSGLSNLRQAKNEILALNFKNKKRERNN